MRRRQIFQQRAREEAEPPKKTPLGAVVECPRCHKPFKKRGLGRHLVACGGDP